MTPLSACLYSYIINPFIMYMEKASNLLLNNRTRAASLRGPRLGWGLAGCSHRPLRGPRPAWGVPPVRTPPPPTSLGRRGGS